MRLENVSHETQMRLNHYLVLLQKWQKTINLVGSKTMDKAWIRHFADSAQVVDLIPQGSRIADLGSGAGFPGLVLAIMRPDLDVYLVESDERKAQFLRTVSRETKAGVTIYNERIENVLCDVAPDIIIARALASLVGLMDLTYPYIGKNSAVKMILLKGRSADLEIREAKELYSFCYEGRASITDSDSCILTISNIQKL